MVAFAGTPGGAGGRLARRLGRWRFCPGQSGAMAHLPRNQRVADAGIALTPAGATHPYGRDPRDRTIRLAPTFPSLTDLEQAMRGLVTCARLVAAG